MKIKVLLALLFASPSLALAQVVVSNGSILSIQPSVTFYSGGDFTNNGQVLNNGNLIISGAWTNEGDYQAESGQVTFNGATPQIINHNAQSFANLLITGGGEKIFNADIFIQQSLSLQNGLLTTANGSKIIMDDGATVTGGSSSSFVRGAIYTTGTGQKFFPVGEGTTYLPLTMLSVAGTAPLLGVEAFQPNQNTNFTNDLKAVSALRSWSIRLTSGTFTGSPVTLPLLNETFDDSESVVVAQSPNAEDPFFSLGRIALTGNLQSGTVTSKEPLTLLSGLAYLSIGLENNPDKTVSVFNAVTPGNDGKHDFLKIVNIEYYPGNEVTIVNRWGDKVYQMNDYNNDDRRFNGDGNVGGLQALSDGTYYYVIDKKNGDKKMSGFFILKR